MGWDGMGWLRQQDGNGVGVGWRDGGVVWIIPLWDWELYLVLECYYPFFLLLDFATLRLCDFAHLVGGGFCELATR